MIALEQILQTLTDRHESYFTRDLKVVVCAKKIKMEI